MPRQLPDAVQRQIEQTEAMDAEIASAAPPAPAEPDPPPAPVAEPAPTPPVAEETWQQKYLSLQGKYNAEVPEFRRQIAELNEQIKTLKAAPSTTPPAAPEPAAPAPKLVTDADVETFGADLVDLMRRVVNETDAGEKARLQSEIDKLKGQNTELTRSVEQVTGAVTDDKRATYFADLGKLVPDYDAVNVDEAFLGWLSLPDPLSGTVRDALLQSAFNAFDHKRTAVIFNAYKQETGFKAPPAAAPAAEPPAPESLEAQVSPAGSKVAATITPDDGKKVWASHEVQEFYNAVTRGDYRGNAAEMQRIDAEIDKALIEGRVRA